MRVLIIDVFVAIDGAPHPSGDSLRQPGPETVKRVAAKYIWWKSPEEGAQQPRRVVAQVMDIGDYDDVLELEKQADHEYLCEVLTHAEIGQFSPRSWVFWHYRLGLCDFGKTPPMPHRRVA